MPTNLYGPNDNYDLEKSHVLPAMQYKFITANSNNSPEVELRGTGSPRREFLHVDDLAEACLYVLQHYNEQGLVNIGTGEDVTIKELAELIQSVTRYKGQIRWNTDKPDSTPRKLMDVSKINSFGWKSKIDMPSGIRQVYSEVKEVFNK
jgi:GDP-L-fucose synthase